MNQKHYIGPVRFFVAIAGGVAIHILFRWLLPMIHAEPMLTNYLATVVGIMAALAIAGVKVK